MYALESLARLPSILIVTIGMHLSFTPPGVSSESDQAPVLSIWDRYLNAMGSLRGPIKGVYWAVGIAEFINIIANGIPMPNELTHFLSSIYLYGSASKFRYTLLAAIGTILIALGAFIQIRCYRVMGHLFTFEHSIRVDHNLITKGPYGVVRHPGYAGLLVVYVGMFCWYGSRGSWLRESRILDTIWGSAFFGGFAVMMIGLLFGLLRRMSREDDALKEVFGYEWVEWSERVPYSLIPRLY